MTNLAIDSTPARFYEDVHRDHQMSATTLCLFSSPTTVEIVDSAAVLTLYVKMQNLYWYCVINLLPIATG